MNSAPIYLDLDSNQRQPDEIPTSFSIPFDNQTVIIGKKTEKFFWSIKSFTTTYDATMLLQARIYLNVYTTSFRGDKPSIFFSNPLLNGNRFILTRDKVLSDIAFNPLWVTFKSDVVQMIRFIGNTSIVVVLTDMNGVQIPDDDPTRRVFVTFELKEKVDDRSGNDD
jgi:hypothetical protein